VAELKDNINTMISQPARDHRVEPEQDWLKTNLARFTGMLQGQRDLVAWARCCCPSWRRWSTRSRASLPLRYGRRAAEAAPAGQLRADGRRPLARRSTWARAWSASARSTRRSILLTDVPETSSHRAPAWAKPSAVSVLVLPVLFENQTKA
jgi:hypothetical protein